MNKINLLNLKIVHYTKEENIESIITTWCIADQLHRPNNIYIGEGSYNRICVDYKCKNYENVHEAIGIYFRIISTNDVYKIPQIKGFRHIILKSEILDKYDWHLNSTENNGFYIFNKYAHFSGDMCDKNIMQTFEKHDIHLLDYDSFTKMYKPELIIRTDKISLDYVDWIM